MRIKLVGGDEIQLVVVEHVAAGTVNVVLMEGTGGQLSSSKEREVELVEGQTATVDVALQNVSGVVRGTVTHGGTGSDWARYVVVKAYAPIPGYGERLVGYAPHGHWKTITFVGGLRQRGMTAPFVLEGAINGPMFLAFPSPRRVELPVSAILPPNGPVSRSSAASVDRASSEESIC